MSPSLDGEVVDDGYGNAGLDENRRHLVLQVEGVSGGPSLGPPEALLGNADQQG
jgi:hypothetical protein